jgi:hypothetical protein
VVIWRSNTHKSTQKTWEAFWFAVAGPKFICLECLNWHWYRYVPDYLCVHFRLWILILPGGSRRFSIYFSFRCRICSADLFWCDTNWEKRVDLSQILKIWMHLRLYCHAYYATIDHCHLRDDWNHLATFFLRRWWWYFLPRYFDCLNLVGIEKILFALIIFRQ